MRSIFRQTSLASLAYGALLFFANTASAQMVDVPPTWGGDLWSRPRLTGDWDDVRDALGKKGIVLVFDMLLTPQAVTSGGVQQGGKFWGNTDYTLNVDTGKAGLWPGGFFKFEGDTGFGQSALQNSGSLVPVNTTALLPAPNDNTSALLNATFTQFFSNQFGVLAGKINTLDLGAGEFTGDYKTQFMNASFDFPMTLDLLPLSAFGAGVIGLPRDDVTLLLLALDLNGTASSNDLAHAFSDGVTLFGSGQATVKPFGLVGHQQFGFSWSNKERFSIDQDPTNIAKLLLQNRFPRLTDPGPALEDVLTRFFPNLLSPTSPPAQESETWSMFYSFDQYFSQPTGDPKHGIGLFFNFGASDGNPNPIKYAFFAGLGGKGVIPGLDDDIYGIGFARSQISSEFVPFLRNSLNLGLEHNDVVELYYNAALTGWLLMRRPIFRSSSRGSASGP